MFVRDEYGGRVRKSAIGEAMQRSSASSPESEMEKLMQQLGYALEEDELSSLVMALRGLYIVGKATVVYNAKGWRDPIEIEHVKRWAPAFLQVAGIELQGDEQEIGTVVDRAVKMAEEFGYARINGGSVSITGEGVVDFQTIMMIEAAYS